MHVCTSNVPAYDGAMKKMFELSGISRRLDVCHTRVPVVVDAGVIGAAPTECSLEQAGRSSSNLR